MALEYKGQNERILVLEGCLSAWLGHGPSPLTHLEFASIQLQQLRPIHLPCSKLGSILFQAEALQPLAHLLTGPVVDSRERFIQELGWRPRRVRGKTGPVACTPGSVRGQAYSPHLKTGTVCGKGRNTWSPAGDHSGSWGCCWGVWSHHSGWIPRQGGVHTAEERACSQGSAANPLPSAGWSWAVGVLGASVHEPGAAQAHTIG